MNLLQRDRFLLVLILLAFAASFAARGHLPYRIAAHWGIDGRVDAHLPARLAAYLYPAAMLLVYLFFLLIPYAEKGRTAQLREIGLYEPLRHGAIYLFAYAHVLVLGIGLGWVSTNANFLAGCLALLILLAGRYMPRVRPAAMDRLLYRAGFAPSDRAWKFLGRVLVVAGICGILGTLTGRLQLVWLLLPLLLGGFLVFRRFPAAGGPAA